MKRLKSSSASKVIAFILLTITIPLSVLSAFGFAVLEEEGFYSGTASSFYDTSYCRSLTSRHAINAAELYASGYDTTALANLYTPDKSNFAFELYEYDNPEKPLAASAIPELYFFYSDEVFTIDTYLEEYLFEDGAVIDEYGNEGSASSPVEKTFVVKTYLRDPIQLGDDYWNYFRAFSMLFSMQGSLPVIAIGFAIVSVLLLLFCLSAAGHKKV